MKNSGLIVLGVSVLYALSIGLLLRQAPSDATKQEAGMSKANFKEIFMPQPAVVQKAVARFEDVWRRGDVFTPARPDRMPIPQIPLPVLPDPQIAFPPVEPFPCAKVAKYFYANIDSFKAALPQPDKLQPLLDLTIPEIPVHEDLTEQYTPKFDEIVLDSTGKSIFGEIVEQNAQSVTIIEQGGKVKKLEMNQVRQIKKRKKYLEIAQEKLAAIKNNDPKRRMEEVVDYCLKNGMRGYAKTVLEMIMKESPNFPGAFLLMAQMLEDENEFDKALAILKKSAETFPGDAYKFNFEIGKVLETFGLFELAIDYYVQSYWISLPDGKVNAAKLHYLLGNYQTALNMLDDLIRTNVTGPKVYLYRAICLYKTGDLAEAQKAASQVADFKDAVSADAKNLQGAISFCNGAYADAVASFLAALNSNQFCTDAWFNLALVFALAGDQPNCGAVLQKLKDRDPTSPLPYGITAFSNFQNKDIDKGIADAQVSTEVDPAYFYGHYLLGVLQLKKGDIDNATNSMKRVLELNPDFLPAYLPSSMAFGSKEMYREAESLLRELTARNPDDSAAGIALLTLYMKSGKKKEADALIHRIAGSSGLLSYCKSYYELYFEDFAAEKRVDRSLQIMKEADSLGYAAAKPEMEKLKDWLATSVLFDEKFNRDKSAKIGAGWQEVERENFFDISIDDGKAAFNLANPNPGGDRNIAYAALERQFNAENFYSVELTLVPTQTSTLEFGFSIYYQRTTSGQNMGFHVVIANNQILKVGMAEESAFREQTSVNFETNEFKIPPGPVRLLLRNQKAGQFNYDLLYYDAGTSQYKALKSGLQIPKGDKVFKFSAFAKSYTTEKMALQADDIICLEKKPQ